MPRPLAQHLGLARQRSVEEHQRLGIHPAILDEAEAQHVDPRAPRQIRRAGPRRDDGIGKPRTVELEPEPACLGELTQRRSLVGRIGQPIFGRVGDRQCRRLDLVNVGPDPRARRRRRLDCQLGARPVDQHQLRAAIIHRRCPGFVGFDMRVAVAQDRPGRRTQHGKADAVGGSPGGHPQRLDLALENRCKGRVEPRAILVGVIGRLEPVRGADRCDHRRARRSGIVGKEKIDHGPRMTRRLPRVNRTRKRGPALCRAEPPIFVVERA